MGITAMQSVPYALIADSALRVPIPKLEDLYDANMRHLRISETIKWNGKQWVRGDSLLTGFLMIDGDIIIGRNAKVLGDLYVTDSVVAYALKVERADIKDLNLSNNAVIGNDLDVLQNQSMHPIVFSCIRLHPVHKSPKPIRHHQTLGNLDFERSHSAH